MKKNILLFIAYIFVSLHVTTAQQDSVAFLHNWQKALAQAKQENKLVFLDAYTDWCAPCKRMSATTFKSSKVIALLKDKFVPVKLNMEKGEGIGLAKLYQINVYPTLLFVDTEGKMQHIEAGFKDEDAFLTTCQTALNPTEKLAALDEKFQKGNWDSDFLKSYIPQRAIFRNASQDAAVEAYLKIHPDWTVPEVQSFIMQYVDNPASAGFQYLIDNKDKFSTQFGVSNVKHKIQTIVVEELTKGNHRTEPAVMSKYIKGFYGNDAAKYEAKYNVTYSKATIDADKFMLAAAQYFKQYPPEDPAEIAEIATGLSQITQNKDYINTAITWVDDAFKKEENFECILAKAHLYKAMGKTKKAKKMAKQAITWAKKNEDNPQPAEQFLSTL